MDSVLRYLFAAVNRRAASPTGVDRRWYGAVLPAGRRSPISSFRTSFVWLAAWLASGCVVRVYQPLSNLHRPSVIDPSLPNFEGVRLDVICLPGGLLSGQEAGALCQKVGLLFENQGAVVNATTSPGGDDDDDDDPAAAVEPATQLTLELRSRLVNRAYHPASWLLSAATFTVLPALSETTFAQDVVVRDETGFLLASETLEGRIVERFGAGPWLGNKLLDLARPRQERLTAQVMKVDVSNDLYRQLSQTLFNAKMQWEVLQLAPTGRGN